MTDLIGVIGAATTIDAGMAAAGTTVEGAMTTSATSSEATGAPVSPQLWPLRDPSWWVAVGSRCTTVGRNWPRRRVVAASLRRASTLRAHALGMRSRVVRVASATIAMAQPPAQRPSARSAPLRHHRVPGLLPAAAAALGAQAAAALGVQAAHIGLVRVAAAADGRR